jgi:hypothetical protein
MNTLKYHDLKYHHLFNANTEEDAPFRQDKGGLARLSAASSQPLRAQETARKGKEDVHQPDANTEAVGDTVRKSNGLVHPAPSPKHSTRRKTVFAGGWIDCDTDAYIEHRKTIQKLTRSKVIATMLKERSQDDAFARSQTILVPIIQEAIRQEFRAFANRFLSLIARIAYEVSQILSLTLNVLWLLLDKDDATLHRLQTQSETAARVNITRRTPQVEEVIGRLKQELEEGA